MQSLEDTHAIVNWLMTNLPLWLAIPIIVAPFGLFILFGLHYNLKQKRIFKNLTQTDKDTHDNSE